MAIIQCPVCHKRISSLAKVCPHCGAPLGEMTPQMREEIASIKRKRYMMWAKRITLMALTLAMAGALGWWFDGADGWQWPAPSWALTLLILSGVFYLVGRGWLVGLQLTRRQARRRR